METLGPWEHDWVLSNTGAARIHQISLVQSLWGGYGKLLRISLQDGPWESVILKFVVPAPSDRADLVSHQRKARSYQAERTFYRDYSEQVSTVSRVARCLGVATRGACSYLLLEDLRTAGFLPQRDLTRSQAQAGVRWLARFHAFFLDRPVQGLWKEGCYWHLGTRRREWEQMPRGPFKDRAEELDHRLKSARYRTLVHGDAKPPNFCWHPQGRAAAVDFQYVGGGCGIRDVALFLDRAVGRQTLREQDRQWLDFYFDELRRALMASCWDGDLDALEQEWRSLYPVAWSDYCRFALGWAADYQPDDYSRRQLELSG